MSETGCIAAFSSIESKVMIDLVAASTVACIDGNLYHPGAAICGMVAGVVLFKSSL